MRAATARGVAFKSSREVPKACDAPCQRAVGDNNKAMYCMLSGSTPRPDPSVEAMRGKKVACLTLMEDTYSSSSCFVGRSTTWRGVSQ